MKRIIIVALSVLSINAQAQKKAPISVSGTLGVIYEGYGLTVNPKTPVFYPPRRPWNQVRFNIAPKLTFGKNFTLPFNLNFATTPTNFAGPYSGIGALGRQSFAQFITNPMNNFSINPKYKWADLQLGTQYLNYSELSTGDIGVFGAGVDLKPKGYIIKFFTGTSQQGINYSASPLVPGAYKRTNWMAQLGKEKEGKYKLAFTAAKGKDLYNSASPPPLVDPQEGFVMSFLTDGYFKKGYYISAEGAQGIYTKNSNAGISSTGGVKSFKPFISSNLSTIKDYAATGSIGKKSANFDIGLRTKYLGAGFFTTGYPYLQPDRFEYTVNTRFNAWKDSAGNFKMNVVASAGQRINNMSSTTLRAKQFIGSLNWFTQFNDRFNVNITYSNFGFNTVGSTISGIPSIKNVSNDFGVNPTYTWSNTKMSNLLSLSYNYSKYDETVITPPAVTTSNNTHTALLTYVPTFFTKKIATDFSLLYFLNKIPGFTTRLITISAGAGGPLAKDKLNLRGQLQYTIGKNGAFTSNNNFIASLSADWMLTKKLKWNTFITTNRFKYGNELGVGLIGANYLESTIRTGLTYRLK